MAKKRDPREARTSEGHGLDMHVASYNLQKNVARLTNDPTVQRDHREGCDEAELGGRVAQHLRVENYPKLDRR